MLSKDPADRYGDYDKLLSDLQSLVPGSQVIARIVPRIIAATIDAISVMILAVVTENRLRCRSLGSRLLGVPNCHLPGESV